MEEEVVVVVIRFETHRATEIKLTIIYNKDDDALFLSISLLLSNLGRLYF